MHPIKIKRKPHCSTNRTLLPKEKILLRKEDVICLWKVGSEGSKKYDVLNLNEVIRLK